MSPASTARAPGPPGLEREPPSAGSRPRLAAPSSVDAAIVAVGALGALLVAVVAAAIGSNPAASTVDVIVPVLTAAAFMAGGLVAWARRPHNRCGPLMLWTGLSFLAAGLAATDIDPLEAVGRLAETLPLAAAVHLLLAFPSGHVPERAARAVVVAGYVVALVLQVPRELLGDGSSPLHVVAAPAADDALAAFQAFLGIALLVCAAAIMRRRLRRAGPAARQALGPLSWYGPLALVVAAAGAATVDASSSDGIQMVAGIVQTVALAGLPLAFLAGLLRGGFGRAGEVHELLAGVEDAAVDPDELRRALARALGDESLQVLYRRDGAPGYVDERGAAVALPGDGARRAAPVALGHEVVGALAYDATLIADRALVDELARVCALVIEHHRLTAQLRANVAELQAAAAALHDARRRIVRAADGERRRVARDLHDGAQQRIVALGIQAQRIARRASDPELVAREAGELSSGLVALLDELRALVQGLMPVALVERGLASAVAVLAERAPLPVAIDAGGLERRLAEDVEATAYFVIAESLTNTVKHAHAGEAEVEIREAAGALVVEVRDDGGGGSDPAAGSGLRGLADRVAALGGTLAVADRPGGGTVVRAEIPCGS
jgi:signal transduction histidine kinase